MGGGAVAARKAHALAGFGAALLVIAPNVTPELLTLEGVDLRHRRYAGPADLSGAALALAATPDRELNRRVAADARTAGIPVNVADEPELCDFFFPALVRRGAAVAGISTGGLCPRLAARLRRHLEQTWPASLGAALETLAAKREALWRQARSQALSHAEAVRWVTEELDRLIDELAANQQDSEDTTSRLP